MLQWRVTTAGGQKNRISPRPSRPAVGAVNTKLTSRQKGKVITFLSGMKTNFGGSPCDYVTIRILLYSTATMPTIESRSIPQARVIEHMHSASSRIWISILKPFDETSKLFIMNKRA
jgi:hypothetical protein